MPTSSRRPRGKGGPARLRRSRDPVPGRGLAPYLPSPLRAAAPRSPLRAAASPPRQVCLKRPPHPAALSQPLSLPPSLSVFPSLVQPAGKKPAAPGAMESLALPTSGGRGGTHRRGGGGSPRHLPVSESLRLLLTWASRGRVFLCVCPVLLTRLGAQPRDGAAPRKDVARQPLLFRNAPGLSPRQTGGGRRCPACPGPCPGRIGVSSGKAQPPRALLQRRDS